MALKCISVYTGNFEAFSDIFEQVLNTTLHADEELEIDGIVVSEAGEVTPDYVERMRVRPEVVVMKHKMRDITIFQHGGVFEIILPDKEAASV